MFVFPSHFLRSQGKAAVNQKLLLQICTYAGAIPYVAILGILIHYAIRRILYKTAVRRRSILGFYPSSAALATVFLISSMLFRPRLQYAIQAQQAVETEDDDDGGPDSPGRLDKQLRMVRRGESIERLILRL